jgi:hypothetical protein
MDWLQGSLARKLFLSYVLVIVVGIITLFPSGRHKSKIPWPGMHNHQVWT